MTSEEIITEWLALRSSTAHALDFNAHMALVASHVQVLGVPGFDVISYDDWARQCREEFDQRLLAEVKYSDSAVITATATRIMFRTREVIKTSGGEILDRGLEIIIEKADVANWQVTQERVLSDKEAQHGGVG